MEEFRRWLFVLWNMRLAPRNFESVDTVCCVSDGILKNPRAKHVAMFFCDCSFFFFPDVRALFKKVTTRLLATYSSTPG